MTVSFSMRMDEKLKARLEREAEAEDRPASYLANKAIEQFLDSKLQKRELIRAAHQSSLSEKEFISGEAVDAWVDSWGTEKEKPMPKPDIFR